mmetsp:Transcript_13571/g.34553  ORF Transcript_13571/g.34553 Transcript_13571/m.34553 type:complete len:184 (+) Transcript_13571:558-1109(+)
MLMAPPTEFTHGYRKFRGYNYAKQTLPVSTVLGESIRNVDFPGSHWFPGRVTEIFNIVPRKVAHRFFVCLSSPTFPPGFQGDGTGDRIWFGLLEQCNMSISWHPIEYHLVRDANDPKILLELRGNLERGEDLMAASITPPDVIPQWMIIFRNEWQLGRRDSLALFFELACPIFQLLFCADEPL